MTSMKFHPLANMFPLLEGEGLAELVESIRERGQSQAIVPFEGKILDGRNRYRACLAAGVEPFFDTEFAGSFKQARDFVIDANIRRRHLDASQRAMIAARLANMVHGGDRRSDQAANLQFDTTQARAAQRLNVSERSVASARRVVEHGSPDLVAAVDSGEVAVSVAAKVARERPELQADFLRRRAESKGAAAASKAEPRAPALRSLENISGGELARWTKVTTPNDWPHVIQVLRMCADLLQDELDAALVEEARA